MLNLYKKNNIKRKHIHNVFINMLKNNCQINLEYLSYIILFMCTYSLNN